MNPDLGYPLLWLLAIAAACAIAVLIGLRLDERWEDEQREADIARILRNRYRDHTKAARVPDFVPEEWCR